STLTDDYYRYNEKQHTLRGESTGRVFRLGDRQEVQVVRVDLERRRVDFIIEGMQPVVRPARVAKPRRGGKEERSRAPKGRRPRK
ncbi:MAG: ribonuclease R, partial [Acidobacteriota bacterium]